MNTNRGGTETVANKPVLPVIQSVFFLFLTLFAASTAFSAPNKTASPNLPSPRGSIGCYYQLDDKADDSTDPARISTWEDEKFKAFIKNGPGSNLLDARDGGGPDGAQWNPETNLFCAAQFPMVKPEEIKTLGVFFNNKRSALALKKTPSGTDTFISFWVPKETWQRSTRKGQRYETITIAVRATASTQLTVSGTFRAAFGE